MADTETYFGKKEVRAAGRLKPKRSIAIVDDKVSGDHNVRFVEPPSIERCPKCDGVGKPIAVRSQLTRVIVNYRCPYCQTVWEKIRPEQKSA